MRELWQQRMAEPNHRQTEVYVEPENQGQSREPARRSPGRQVVFQNDRDNCDNRSRSRRRSCITDLKLNLLLS